MVCTDSPLCAWGITTPQHMPNGSHQPKQTPKLLQGFGNIIGENSSFHSGKLGSRHRKPDTPPKQQSNSFLNQGSLCKSSSRFLHFADCFGELVLVFLGNLEKTSSKLQGYGCAVQRMSASDSVWYLSLASSAQPRNNSHTRQWRLTDSHFLFASPWLSRWSRHWDSSPYVFSLNTSLPRHLRTESHRSQRRQCNNTCAKYLLSKRSKSGSWHHSCILSEDLKVVLKIMLGLLEIYDIILGCLWAFSPPCLVAYKLQ